MRIIRQVIIVFLALFVALPAFSQNQEMVEFYKKRKEQTKEFKAMRKKANDEFTEYLAIAWEEFSIQRGRKDPVGILPDVPTYYNAKDAESVTRSHGFPSSEYLSSFKNSPVMCPAISAEYASGAGSVIVDFFGVVENIPFDQSMRLPRIKAEEKSVSEGWKYLSNADFLATVEAFEAIVEANSLSDWALYTAIKKFTDAVYIDEYINEKILTQMFILCQMKYKVRVGMSGNELIILLPFTSPIYQTAYITASGDDFYIYSYSRLNSRNPLYTFANDFSQSDRKFNLVVDEQLKVAEDYYMNMSQPKWAALIGNDFSVPINQPCVKFYLDYPQSDLLTYHKSAVDKKLENAVFKKIRYEVLKGEMGPVEAVAFVMNIIQKGFDYKTDIEMFGRAKPLFVEESFYYGANNCKDRVLILSWIAKELFGLNTVMFCYEGHVACGIEFPTDVKGDSYVYQGKTYTMCDPTYIGAPIGATMPQFRNVKPEIVAL